MLAVQAHDRSVTTVEGLARDGSLHPIQDAFVSRFGLQCGFCTPGFVMASYALLTRNPNPSEEEIRHDLSSNLCMCTGYVQIVEAVKEAASRLQQWDGSRT
jgi:aerobic carbon-monoxide dehydrogenase small subunit